MNVSFGLTSVMSSAAFVQIFSTSIATVHEEFFSIPDLAFHFTA
jgi:hypothetical protein